jgi:hypothetical protein
VPCRSLVIIKDMNKKRRVQLIGLIVFLSVIISSYMLVFNFIVKSAKADCVDRFETVVIKEEFGNQIKRKKYYKDRIKDRRVMILNKKMDSMSTTDVSVDVVLVRDVDAFLNEADKRGVNLDRLLDLDFVAYDYIPSQNFFEVILGFQQSEVLSKDYIVINSHAGMCQDVRRMVVFHELTHHLRNDGFHCEGTECSLIMNAFLNKDTVGKINENLEEELDILFENIKELQSEK